VLSLRAGQAVVAGDPKQLPPTSFFASGSSQDDEDEEIFGEEELDTSAAMTRNYDSILDVMGALLPPPIGTKRLLWHYRSKDERLIAFSNSQSGLYDWSLTTFPGSGNDEVVTHELVPLSGAGSVKRIRSPTKWRRWCGQLLRTPVSAPTRALASSLCRSSTRTGSTRVFVVPAKKTACSIPTWISSSGRARSSS